MVKPSYQMLISQLLSCQEISQIGCTKPGMPEAVPLHLRESQGRLMNTVLLKGMSPKGDISSKGPPC